MDEYTEMYQLQNDYSEMEILSKLNEMRGFCDPDIPDEVVILALKKNNLDIEETLMLLLDPERVADLQTELLVDQKQQDFIPIVS